MFEHRCIHKSDRRYTGYSNIQIPMIPFLLLLLYLGYFPILGLSSVERKTSTQQQNKTQTRTIKEINQRRVSVHVMATNFVASVKKKEDPRSLLIFVVKTVVLK